MDDAQHFFEGEIPLVKHFDLKLEYSGIIVALSTRDIPLSVNLSRSIDARHATSHYLKNQVLTHMLRHWPRLLRALESKQISGIQCGVHFYPIETIVVSPELLRDQNAPCQVVEESAALKLFYQGQVCYYGKEFARALEYAQKALLLDEGNPVFLVLQGSCESKLSGGKKLGDAVASFKEAQRGYPEMAKVYSRLAKVLIDRSRYDVALVTLFKGAEFGVYETGAGGKMFALGRQCCKQCFRRQTTVSNMAHPSCQLDYAVFGFILDQLALFDVVSCAQVCVWWSSRCDQAYWKKRWFDGPPSWSRAAWTRGKVVPTGFKAFLNPPRLERFPQYSGPDWRNACLGRRLTPRALLIHGVFGDELLHEPLVFTYYLEQTRSGRFHLTALWERLVGFLGSHGFPNAASDFPLLMPLAQHSRLRMERGESAGHYYRASRSLLEHVFPLISALFFGGEYLLLPLGKKWCTTCCLPMDSLAPGKYECEVKTHTGTRGGLLDVIVLLEKQGNRALAKKLTGVWKTQYGGKYSQKRSSLPWVWSCCGAEARQRFMDGCSPTDHSSKPVVWIRWNGAKQEEKRLLLYKIKCRPTRDDINLDGFCIFIGQLNPRKGELADLMDHWETRAAYGIE